MLRTTPDRFQHPPKHPKFSETRARSGWQGGLPAGARAKTHLSSSMVAFKAGPGVGAHATVSCLCAAHPEKNVVLIKQTSWCIINKRSWSSRGHTVQSEGRWANDDKIGLWIQQLILDVFWRAHSQKHMFRKMDIIQGSRVQKQFWPLFEIWNDFRVLFQALKKQLGSFQASYEAEI